jgi:nucleoside diphosphate kinase
MPLRDDITAEFEKKGLKFVSLNESTIDPQKSTLVYIDSSGKSVNKEINIRISELEDTLTVLEAMDPEDLANFLLK